MMMMRIEDLFLIIIVTTFVGCGGLSSMSLEGGVNSRVPDEDTEWGRALKKDARAPPLQDLGQDDDDSPPVCNNPPEINEQVDIAIVGGGLAGLAVAIGLSRAGVNCKVYERAPQLRSESQGMLSLAENGMRALESIHPDISDLVSQVGAELRIVKSTVIHANGTLDEKTTEDGRSRILITWHNMQQVLASLLPPDVIRTSRSLSYFEEKEDFVLMHMEGGSVVRAQAVLACDGVFSVVRRQMFPQDSPIFFGQLNWASIIQTSELPPDLHPANAVTVISYKGEETRWSSFLNDAGSGFTFWQLRVADPEKAMALSGNNGRGGLGLPNVKEALLPVAEPSKDLSTAIASTPESRIFERSIVGCYPLPTWLSQGSRVVLVGDSAHGMHPLIGQGANSAFESASDVIQSMVRHHKNDGDWKKAFMEYQQVRKPRADLVQQFANAMGVLQATGRELMPQPLRSEMAHWIMSNDLTTGPPKEVVDILAEFDPCDEPGVSSLW